MKRANGICTRDELRSNGSATIRKEIVGGGGGPKVLRPSIQHGDASCLAKEFEPFLPANPNPMMVHDFGSYGMKTFELPCR